MKPQRLLLDQMIDGDVSEELLKYGNDVIRVADIGLSRADDEQILKRAIEDNRILVTLDEHFGDWAVLPLDKEYPGVIRIKVNPTSSSKISAVLIPFLERYSNRVFKSHLVIVSQYAIRWIQTIK